METSIDPWKLALFSAMLGGSFTLVGQLFSYYLQKRAQLDHARAELNSLLMSFHVEIEALYERYIENVGPTFAHSQFSEGITFRIHAYQDYLSVFSANAHRIGQISNESLRKNILQTYIVTKSLLDSYATNNITLDELLELGKASSVNPQMDKTILIQYQQRLKDYGPVLAGLHESYCKKVHSVLAEIKQHIASQ